MTCAPIEARVEALEQAVQRLRAVIEQYLPQLVIQELRDRLQSALGRATPGAEIVPDVTPISLDDQIREVEATLIQWAMRVSHGNKSRAADLLKVKRSTLGDRINRCGISQVDHAESVPSAAEQSFSRDVVP